MAKHVQDSNLDHMRSSQSSMRADLCGVRKVIYLKLHKNEIINFPGKWMELEDVILTEVTQTQEEKCHAFSPIGGS